MKNLPLIASFLGLGLGFAIIPRKKSLFPHSVLLLALILGLGALFGLEQTMPGPASVEANLGVAATNRALSLALFYILISGVFALVVMAMIPLGQIAGEYMEGLPSLPAYTANVAGALLGIFLFFAFAAFSLPPWTAAVIVFGVCLCYMRPSAYRNVSVGIAVIASMGMAAADYGPERTFWSPYNKIKIRELPAVETPGNDTMPIGWVLEVNNGYYQRMLDLSPETVEAVGDRVTVVAAADHAYNYPYTWAQPRKVLIVGAGSGNDVAAALRHGAQSVDAVEIDPRILKFGRDRHPEDPYGDPRVTIIEADARQHLKDTEEKYDLIVFGLLDNHLGFYSTLSSSIRLDSYVYTVEALAEAADRLTPDGVLSLAFYVDQAWIVGRLDNMLTEAFGRSPLVTKIDYDAGYVYLTGPGVPERSSREEVNTNVVEKLNEFHVPGPNATDDWPFLYLANRELPATVWQASLGMLLVTLVLVLVVFRGEAKFDRHLFFLGAGFLLVETRTIAQLGLIFGATWRVSAIAIAVILALILVANYVITRRGPMRRLPLYVGLGLALLANYLVPPAVALGGGAMLGVAITVFYLLPLLFAALIFASSITLYSGLAVPLASNFVGAVLGGLLENLSMVIGISALSLLAITLYAASFKR